jgi:hypothetical protein
MNRNEGGLHDSSVVYHMSNVKRPGTQLRALGEKHQQQVQALLVFPLVLSLSSVIRSKYICRYKPWPDSPK